MASALIGATGFVGGQLRRQAPFDDLYNSKTIGQIAGKDYDLLVCAGAPAEKWKANRDPLADERNLQSLMGHLGQVEARKFILISTVDVYPTPQNVDEETPIDSAGLIPYGKHRRGLEVFVQERFDAAIVRLPALFGEGLKKNAVYDLLHDQQTERIDADSVFQFYPLDRLWRDLQRILRRRIPIMNLATEPIGMREVARAAFDLEFANQLAGAPPRYDVRTKYAGDFGGARGYLLDKPAVLAALRCFVTAERGRRQ